MTVPQLFFCINALQKPENLAQSFAEMQVLSQATNNISWRVASIPRDLRFFARTLESVVKLYEATEIKNKVVDGTEAFMLDGSGLEIEFR
jgi:hypothetical protein